MDSPISSDPPTGIAARDLSVYLQYLVDQGLGGEDVQRYIAVLDSDVLRKEIAICRRLRRRALLGTLVEAVPAIPAIGLSAVLIAGFSLSENLSTVAATTYIAMTLPLAILPAVALTKAAHTLFRS